ALLATSRGARARQPRKAAVARTQGVFVAGGYGRDCVIKADASGLCSALASARHAGGGRHQAWSSVFFVARLAAGFFAAAAFFAGGFFGVGALLVEALGLPFSALSSPDWSSLVGSSCICFWVVVSGASATAAGVSSTCDSITGCSRPSAETPCSSVRGCSTVSA